MKNIIGMKSTLGGTDSRLVNMKEYISGLEGKVVEISQLGQQKEKKSK